MKTIAKVSSYTQAQIKEQRTQMTVECKLL